MRRLRSRRTPSPWPALPAFLLLARVIAPPRFLQIARAALLIFSPLLVLFPRRSLTFFVVQPAPVRHATLPLPLHLRWSVHPRRRLTICPAPLPMSPARRTPDPRPPDL